MPPESKPTSEPIEADTLLPRPKGSLPLVVLAGLGIVVAIYLARDLLIPLVLAVLLALLLRPLLRRMQRLHLPDFASAALLILAVAAVTALVAVKLAGQAQEWLTHAPTTVESVSKMLPSKSGGPIGREHLADALDRRRRVSQPLL